MHLSNDCNARVTMLEVMVADIGSWRLELEGVVDDIKL